MGWKEVYESERQAGGERFSREWYANHFITREILKRGLLRGRVCDVGCGLGRRSLVLAEATNLRFTGVDSDHWAVDFARAESASQRIAVDFLVSDFYSLPLPNGSFDTLLLVAGIEHAAFPVTLIRELLRLVSPRGRVVITVTLNNLHADPDHKSAFSERGLARFLGAFGTVETWVSDNVIYAVLEKRGTAGVAWSTRLVYADMRHPDTYTEYWDAAFRKCVQMVPVSFGLNGHLLSGEETRLLEAIDSADVLHVGTGAVHLDRGLLEEIRKRRPRLHISKWWGDLSPERYASECSALSDLYDTIFLSVSNYVGDCRPSCTQLHMNSPGVQPSGEFIPPHLRVWDIGLFANAYSEARRASILSLLPRDRWKFIWCGDGSPVGRVSRTATNPLIGLTRTNLNIVEPAHMQFRHWFSARVSNALAAGSVVITSHIDGVKEVLGNTALIAGSEPGDWRQALDFALSDPARLENMSRRGVEFFNRFLSYERAVNTMLTAWGCQS
jgi:SAM-dependent methyltransferase